MAVLGALAVALVLAWLGLRVRPRPFPPVPLVPSAPATIPPPDDLPAPVRRFYGKLHGDEVPAVDSAVVSGRGTMRIKGLRVLVRFRFAHDAGRAYRHHIEVALFGARALTVHETFLDGVARLELPFGVSEGANVDQAANLGLWAEAVWFPSLWCTDPRVHWEAVDDHAARLVVPFGDTEETFTVAFDPTTGLLRRMESMRFKGDADETKTPWFNDVVRWGEVDGRLLPLVTTLTWGDERSPWARLVTEEVVYGVDVAEYVRSRGPYLRGR